IFAPHVMHFLLSGYVYHRNHHSFPTRRSSDLFKAVSTLSMFNSGEVRRNGFQNSQVATIQERLEKASDARAQEAAGGKIIYAGVDRKSTRLNSSHVKISYAVFCLKKKKFLFSL